MNLKLLRNVDHENHAKTTRRTQRHQHQITNSMTDERQQQLEKYIRNAERGCLPMSHDGADVSRPLNAMRIAKYRKCPDCTNGSKENPIKVSIQIKTAKGEARIISLCTRHWDELAPTVIGWSGE